MNVGPLKSGYRVEVPQPTNKTLPSLPMRGLFLGPSSAGKTNLIVTMLTDPRFYKNKFSKIYWMSPSATIDPGLDPLREYVKTLDQNQDDDPTFHDFVDVEFLTEKINRQKKLQNILKKLNYKKDLICLSS